MKSLINSAALANANVQWGGNVQSHPHVPDFRYHHKTVVTDEGGNEYVTVNSNWDGKPYGILLEKVGKRVDGSELYPNLAQLDTGEHIINAPLSFKIGRYDVLTNAPVRKSWCCGEVDHRADMLVVGVKIARPQQGEPFLLIETEPLLAIGEFPEGSFVPNCRGSGGHHNDSVWSSH